MQQLLWLSAEFVGEFRFWKSAKCMKQGKWGPKHRVKNVGRFAEIAATPMKSLSLPPEELGFPGF
jgi:hypothetical protein